MDKILSKNYIQTVEKDIALILLPAVVCLAKKDFQSEFNNVVKLFSTTIPINVKQISAELNNFVALTHLTLPKQTSHRFFENCYYKNDKDEDKILKRLALGIHYVNKIQLALVSKTPMFKSIGPMMHETNSKLKIPITNSDDLECYSMGSNPLTVDGKLTKKNFVNSLYKTMFRLNSENKALANSSSVTIPNSNIDDHKNFFELRRLIAESIYGVRSKNEDNEYLIDKISHMFKEHLVNTKKTFSNNSDDDVLKNPIIEIIEDLKDMLLYDVDLQFNKDYLKTDAYEQRTSSHHLEFFRNVIDGIATFNKKTNNLDRDSNEIKIMEKMNNYADLFVRLNIPLLRSSVNEHLKEVSLIVNKSLEIIYKKPVIENKNKPII